jgi:polyferredoxin
MKIYGERCAFFHEYRQICPMDLEVHKTPNDKDCIRCLDCAKCRSVVFKAFWKE